VSKRVVQPVQNFSPKTENQRTYYGQLKTHDVVFGIGPAGTGKTYTAAHFGVQQLDRGVLDSYVIIRPTVGVENEDLGALPGDLEEKIAPWAMPVMQEITKVAGKDKSKTWVNEGRIETVPIAYIRGRTFENSFIHVCEAQNLTRVQAMAIVTRMGENSRMVIEGDPDQSDLRCGGFLPKLLLVASRGKVPHAVTQFEEADIVRHERVKQWVYGFAA
jgi:phosphate starvation-inducible PhoH-like protein